MNIFSKKVHFFQNFDDIRNSSSDDDDDSDSDRGIVVKEDGRKSFQLEVLE
jgi:hypothetical protein